MVSIIENEKNPNGIGSVVKDLSKCLYRMHKPNTMKMNVIIFKKGSWLYFTILETLHHLIWKEYEETSYLENIIDIKKITRK